MSFLENLICPVTGKLMIGKEKVEIPYDSQGNRITLLESAIEQYGLAYVSQVVCNRGKERKIPVGSEDKTTSFYSPGQIEGILAKRYPLLAERGR